MYYFSNDLKLSKKATYKRVLSYHKFPPNPTLLHPNWNRSPWDVGKISKNTSVLLRGVDDDTTATENAFYISSSSNKVFFFPHKGYQGGPAPLQ